MDFYEKVWSPEGEMFEVQHEVASNLVLNKGWSKNPPAPSVEKPAPKPQAAPAPAKGAPAPK